MSNPYTTLGIEKETATDEEVRRRYLALVRQFSPERHPAEFQSIRSAYETVADERARLRHLIFNPSQGESLEEWVEEIRCEMMSQQLGLSKIRRLFRDA